MSHSNSRYVQRRLTKTGGYRSAASCFPEELRCKRHPRLLAVVIDPTSSLQTQGETALVGGIGAQTEYMVTLVTWHMDVDHANCQGQRGDSPASAPCCGA